jgi:BASS family bile acid:Na+ symporter
MADFIGFAIPATIFALMICIGTELSGDDFKLILKYPKALVLGLLIQILILPAVYFLTAKLMTDDLSLRVGIVLLAACPAGALSNSFVYLAGSKTELSVSLTAVTSLIAVITTPIVAYVGIQLVAGMDAAIDVPALKMIGQILMLIIMPTSMGMILKYWKKDFVGRHKGAIKKLAAGFMLANILIVILSNVSAIRDSIGATLPPAVLLILISFLVGYSVPKLFSLDIDDCFTIAVEASLKNIVLAIILATVSLKRPDLALFSLTYGLSVVLFMIPVSLLFKKSRKFSTFSFLGSGASR